MYNFVILFQDSTEKIKFYSCFFQHSYIITNTIQFFHYTYDYNMRIINFLFTNSANFISILRLLVCLSMLLLNIKNFYSFLIFYFSFWPMYSVDGYVSRRLNISSKLGGIIDLAADRILDCTAALFIVALNKEFFVISATFLILRIVPNCIGIDFDNDTTPLFSRFLSYKLSKLSLRLMQEIYQGVRGFFFSSAIFLNNSYYSEYPFLFFTFIYFTHFFIRSLYRATSKHPRS